MITLIGVGFLSFFFFSQSIACLHDQGKSGFFGGTAFFQSIMAFLACLHDQNKSGSFGGPAFIQPIRAICIVSKNL